jgi:hypothetical protein
MTDLERRAGHLRRLSGNAEADIRIYAQRGLHYPKDWSRITDVTIAMFGGNSQL